MDSDGVILLIDAGNTRLKFGWVRWGNDRREPGILALPHAELEQLPAWLETLPSRPTGALGVNVAGVEVAARVEAVLAAQGCRAVRWVAPTSEAAGIINSYENPTQLGTDRWVSLIGLARHTTGGATLASFGTATTVDTLGPHHATASERGMRRFEGGIILPGVELMRQALANGTAGLPYATGVSTLHPRNTHAAISSGIAAAQAGAVLRQWRAAIDVLGEIPGLYCTGGGWPPVREEVTASLARVQADLGLPAMAPRELEAPVLDGLAVLAAASPQRDRTA